MNFSNCETCIRSKLGCNDCRDSVRTFFKLLEKVHSRSVSTLKVTSENEPKGSGCIDKLTFNLAAPVQLGELIKRAASNNVGLKQKRLKNRWAYELQDNTNSLFILPNSQNEVQQIVTRPSAYINYPTYKKTIDMLITDEEYARAKISRIDLAVDYPLPLLKILQSIDIKHKQEVAEYISKREKMTGVRFGKGTEKIQIYDKSERNSLSVPLTRIEWQYAGAKLPIKLMSQLPDLTNERVIHLFDNIVFQNVTLIEPIRCDSRRMQIYETFRHTYETRGFTAAKQAINTENNFSRIKDSIIKTEPWVADARYALLQSLKTYFDPINV